MHMKQPQLKNYHAGPRMGLNTIAIGCEDEAGNRFHFWLNTATRNINNDIIYRNPPLTLRRGDPGYFETSKRDATAKANRPLVAAMLDRADGLIAAFVEKERAIEAEQAKLRAEVEREKRIRDAGPELLAALELYFAADPRFHKAASDAIAKARGEVQ
jgi:hypothetical protein